MSLITLLDQALGRHTGTAPNMTWQCPFCSERVGTESSKPKLSVNVFTGRARCWRCDWKTNSAKYLLKSIGQDFDALSLALDQTGMQSGDETGLRSAVMMLLFADEPETENLTPLPLPKEFVPIERCHKKSYTRVAVAYLHERGFSVDEAAKKRIGYCASGRFAQRLIFPVYMNGEVIYHTNRFVSDENTESIPKSFNPKGITGTHGAGTCLLGYDQAVGARVVPIVEGPFDWLATDNSVCTMGKHLSSAHVHLMRQLEKQGTKRFVLLRDSDADPTDNYRLLCGALKCVRVAEMNRGDPASRRKAVGKLVKHAKREVSLSYAVGCRLRHAKLI